MKTAIITTAAVLATSSISFGQLLSATADRDEPLWLTDLTTIRPGNFPVPANIADHTPLVGGFSIWGMAADDVKREYYFIEVATSEIFRVEYDNPTLPISMGILRKPSDNLQITLNGLAVNSSTGQFYGVYNVGGTPGKGVYEIDVTDPPIVGGKPALYVNNVLPFNQLPGGENAYDVRNLDYDPVTNKIYMINDDSDQLGRGLYSVNLVGQSITKIVDSPTYRRNETDFDGLATGGGKAYWVTDEAGFVYVYDLVNGGPFSDFLSPITTESGLLGGAAYAAGLIPEPTTLAAAAALIPLMLRRRS